MKRIPIKTAKDIAERFGQDQVILVTWEKETGRTHVVTYGKTAEECEQAAAGGNRVKRALGWPESLCNAKPEPKARLEAMEAAHDRGICTMVDGACAVCGEPE